ncbi:MULTISPECIES: GyrI-like domain-containing protein [unclassified Neglectibacter]|uniref:GyrI-like domain-containing protein n=1 Tax=unclassified Neglectibacter TaxID=2632164 RepID=UPI00191BE7EB|nr:MULTISPECIES: hypothetical protein [unclassified Neglectibacter]
MAYRIAKKPPLRIVGIRIPLTSDMEDNLRIVPEFWKALLQGEQFLEICKLSNGEPRGILGISVYRNPKEIYYYIGVATNSSAPAGIPVLPSEKKILCPCTSVLDSVFLDFWINEKAATPHHE